MGDALFELRQKLRSNQDKMTSQEANVIMACKAKAMREVTIAAGLGAGLGLGVGAGITCLAWRRLNNFYRINLLVDLSVGAALFGLLKFGRSLYLNIEHTLGPDGTRIQMELVNIMLRNDVDDKWTTHLSKHDKWTTHLLSKHFYAEKVYDDSSSDQPKLRWRHRNFFADNGVPSQRPHVSDSSDDKIDTEKMDVELKQASRNPGADAIADPLDCVLGLPSGFEEISHPVTSSTSSKRHSHRHKRSHRKHRMRHREVSPNSEDTLSF